MRCVNPEESHFYPSAYRPVVRRADGESLPMAGTRQDSAPREAAFRFDHSDGYIPVVRKSSDESEERAPAPEEAAPFAAAPAAAGEISLPASAVWAACPVTAWRQLLKRPWSWRWRRVFFCGLGVCLGLGLLSLVQEDSLPIYALAMSLWIPLTLLVFFHEIDIRREVSGGWLAFTALAGGGIACALAAFVNRSVIGEDGPAFLAGLTEEPIKGAILLALACFPKRFPGILSGLSLGVAVGAGFAVFETLVYAYALSGDGSPNTGVLLVRGAFSPFMHLAWTGALGGAMWAANGGRGGLRTLASPAVWGIFAGIVVLHMIWNLVGPVQYLCIGLWAVIFHYAKRGVAEAAALGYAPGGGLA